jgi:acetyl/propionyl-CoA carboxylase alpha subunit
LVANRGEVASRVIRGAAECGITPIAVFSTDDAGAPFCGMAEAIALSGAGPAAYLDIEAIIAAARTARADALHPGWGFLSESPTLARACAEAGITFVGPPAELLALFGDKLRARELAVASGVPVAETAATLQDGRDLLAQGPVMVKAASGGGGRGMRLVRDLTGLEAAWRDCAAEAQAAFGNGTVYAERYVAQARHVEIQIAGDGMESRALGSRECSLQRRHQKLVEFAPAGVPMVGALTEAALRMAQAANYVGLGTWEFLVAGPKIWFLEVNPRLQVGTYRHRSGQRARPGSPAAPSRGGRHAGRAEPAIAHPGQRRGDTASHQRRADGQARRCQADRWNDRAAGAARRSRDPGRPCAGHGLCALPGL